MKDAVEPFYASLAFLSLAYETAPSADTIIPVAKSAFIREFMNWPVLGIVLVPSVAWILSTVLGASLLDEFELELDPPEELPPPPPFPGVGLGVADGVAVGVGVTLPQFSGP